jgi:hypothetical protein
MAPESTVASFVICSRVVTVLGLILRPGIQPVENFRGPVRTSIGPGDADDSGAWPLEPNNDRVDQFLITGLNVDAALVEVQEHRDLFAYGGRYAERLLIDRLLVDRLQKPVRPVEQVIRTLLPDGCQIADVLPFIRDGPEPVPGHCGVKLQLRLCAAIARAIQYL